ncbi:hypothetical protein Ocin01_19095 [Orchesella cincta]|uniref:oxaloacetate tautomerase n=1 Tax=Orchesella cincta TaxID=48709 RepID=A0A1D2M3N5_ORCCI|nr:hypothetical protein Ocin01_19095 [Orchesella cincta]
MSGNFQVCGAWKIVGVGRYRDHAAELGSAIPEVPLLFMKPATSYITEGTPIMAAVPSIMRLNWECYRQKGTDIPEGNAMNHNVAKQKGTPWDLAKGFDTGCPVGKFIPKASISDPHNLELWCKVNGALKAEGPYDMILTGTPAGVSGVSKGNVIQGGLANLAEIKFKVLDKAGGS